MSGSEPCLDTLLFWIVSIRLVHPIWIVSISLIVPNVLIIDFRTDESLRLLRALLMCLHMSVAAVHRVLLGGLPFSGGPLGLWARGVWSR